MKPVKAWAVTFNGNVDVAYPAPVTREQLHRMGWPEPPYKLVRVEIREVPKGKK